MREGEAPYVRFVRTLPCCSCGAAGPSEAAHMTLGPNEKGAGLKVQDGQVVPLCASCHGYFDGATDGPDNPFRENGAPRDKEKRWATARLWIESTRLLATPIDFDQALHFAELGLGRIRADETGWVWIPCWVDEETTITKEP